MKRSDEERFKRWLIDKLKISRWPYKQSLPLAELSQKLGVREEVLVQAQRELDDLRLSQGLPLTKLGQPLVKSGKTPVEARVEMPIPREIHEEWSAYAEARGLSRAALLRSVLHHFLSQPGKPHHPLVQGWIYRDRELPLIYRYAKESQWPYWLRTTVTEGASDALTLRAQAIGCPEFALVRAIVLDTLVGYLKDFKFLTGRAGMWDDPERYVLE